MRLNIVKRDNCPFWQRCLFYVAAVVCALLLGALILFVIGVDPLEYYYQMFTMGTVGNRIAYKNFITYFKELVPLVITSLALSLSFKMKFWNIGGEGQFIIGAIAAATVAFKLGPVLPSGLTLVIMCAAAMICAALYGMIVALLKIRFGTNETLLTLMLNYIALYILIYIGETKASWNFFLQEGSDRPVFEKFDSIVKFPVFKMPNKFELNICVIVMVIIGVLLYFYLKHTKQGYEINVVGDSMNTAKYAGMKVKWIILRTVCLSAALIGLAACFKVGTAGTLSTQITDDVGWTGIIVAWLAHLNVPMIFVVSALICLLQYGSTVAASTFSNVDSSYANMLQGLILFIVLIADFFTRYKFIIVRRRDENNG